MKILIINGSPRPHGLLSQMLDIMRDTPRFPEPLLKGKRCILVSTCTTPWPFNILFHQSDRAKRAMREICRYSGFGDIETQEMYVGTQENKICVAYTINKEADVQYQNATWREMQNIWRHLLSVYPKKDISLRHD